MMEKVVQSYAFIYIFIHSFIHSFICMHTTQKVVEGFVHFQGR